MNALRRRENVPRRHHYVPVFYQNHFLNVSGLLWVYDRKLNTYKELHPDSVCFKKDLYAVKPEGGSRDASVESEYLAKVDGLGASAIRDIVERKLTRSVQRAVAYFAAHQFMRLPSKRRQISEQYERTAVDAMRVTFANTDRAKEVLDRLAEKTGTRDDMSPELMVQFVKGDNMRLVATEIPFLTNLISQAQELSGLIARFDWQVLVSPEDRGFITCDDPLVIVPPEGVRNVGLAVPGAVKYLPLTRHLCLRLGDFDAGLTFRNIDGETVRTVNKNIAADSDRFIMGPVLSQLQKIVEQSGSTEVDATPRWTTEIVRQDDDGLLRKFTMNPTRYFYAKDGLGKAP